VQNKVKQQQSYNMVLSSAFPSSSPSSGLKIIHAGLFRMGTHSMAKAYRILGYKTFHALDEPDRVDWVTLEKAAEAKWPAVPHARKRPPFSRAEWDALWGTEFDVVCDTAAPFTLELFQAYPDAKVVLVQRDFDNWWPSFQSEIINRLFTPFFEQLIWLAWHLAGVRSGHAMRKLLFGFFHATTQREIEMHGREAYDRFYHDVRATVPPEQLLEFKMGDGWAPLCEFLGLEIPDQVFPFANDRKAHAKTVESRQRSMYLTMVRNALMSILSFGVIIIVSRWLSA
jgi:hypothetical protein